MTILTGKQIVEKKIVQNVDENQVQMCGIDMTVAKVERFAGNGIVDFDNSTRKIPETREVLIRESAIYHNGENLPGYLLDPGCYLITFNEIVDVPVNCCGLAQPRSSLLRCGASMETAVFDPGYHGVAKCLLVVYNKNGLVLGKNAKLMQILFEKLDEDSDKLYTGVYQNEGLCFEN